MMNWVFIRRHWADILVFGEREFAGLLHLMSVPTTSFYVTRCQPYELRRQSSSTQLPSHPGRRRHLHVGFVFKRWASWSSSRRTSIVDVSVAIPEGLVSSTRRRHHAWKVCCLVVDDVHAGMLSNHVTGKRCYCWTYCWLMTDLLFSFFSFRLLLLWGHYSNSNWTI